MRPCNIPPIFGTYSQKQVKEPHSKKLPTDPPKKTNKNPYANQDQEKPLKTERRGEKVKVLRIKVE